MSLETPLKESSLAVNSNSISPEPFGLQIRSSKHPFLGKGPIRVLPSTPDESVQYVPKEFKSSPSWAKQPSKNKVNQPSTTYMSPTESFRNKASEPQTQSTKKPKATTLAASHINSHSSVPESKMKSPSKTSGKNKKEKVKKAGNFQSKLNEEFFPSSHLSASHTSSQSATESILGRTERSDVQQSALIPKSSAQNVPSTPPRSSSVSLSPSRTPKRGNSSSVAPKQSSSVHFSSASLMSSPTVKNNRNVSDENVERKAISDPHASSPSVASNNTGTSSLHYQVNTGSPSRNQPFSSPYSSRRGKSSFSSPSGISAQQLSANKAAKLAHMKALQTRHISSSISKNMLLSSIAPRENVVKPRSSSHSQEIIDASSSSSSLHTKKCHSDAEHPVLSESMDEVLNLLPLNSENNMFEWWRNPDSHHSSRGSDRGRGSDSSSDRGSDRGSSSDSDSGTSSNLHGYLYITDTTEANDNSTSQSSATAGFGHPADPEDNSSLVESGDLEGLPVPIKRKPASCVPSSSCKPPRMKYSCVDPQIGEMSEVKKLSQSLPPSSFLPGGGFQSPNHRQIRHRSSPVAVNDSPGKRLAQDYQQPMTTLIESSTPMKMALIENSVFSSPSSSFKTPKSEIAMASLEKKKELSDRWSEMMDCSSSPYLEMNSGSSPWKLPNGTSLLLKSGQDDQVFPKSSVQRISLVVADKDHQCTTMNRDRDAPCSDEDDIEPSFLSIQPTLCPESKKDFILFNNQPTISSPECSKSSSSSSWLSSSLDWKSHTPIRPSSSNEYAAKSMHSNEYQQPHYYSNQQTISKEDSEKDHNNNNHHNHHNNNSNDDDDDDDDEEKVEVEEEEEEEEESMASVKVVSESNSSDFHDRLPNLPENIAAGDNKRNTTHPNHVELEDRSLDLQMENLSCELSAISEVDSLTGISPRSFLSIANFTANSEIFLDTGNPSQSLYPSIKLKEDLETEFDPISLSSVSPCITPSCFSSSFLFSNSQSNSWQVLDQAMILSKSFSIENTSENSSFAAVEHPKVDEDTLDYGNLINTSNVIESDE